jgi:hypothetical protein
MRQELRKISRQLKKGVAKEAVGKDQAKLGTSINSAEC